MGDMVVGEFWGRQWCKTNAPSKTFFKKKLSSDYCPQRIEGKHQSFGPNVTCT